MCVLLTIKHVCMYKLQDLSTLTLCDQFHFISADLLHRQENVIKQVLWSGVNGITQLFTVLKSQLCNITKLKYEFLSRMCKRGISHKETSKKPT